MGDRNKAIQEFVNAFSEFIYLGESMDDSEKEELSQNNGIDSLNNDISKKDIPNSKPVKARKQQAKRTPKNKSIIPDEQLKTLIDIIETAIEDTQGSALYSVIASKMKKQYSDFVPENYECKNTSALITKILPAIPQYVEHRESIPNNPNGYIMMLKRKNI